MRRLPWSSHRRHPLERLSNGYGAAPPHGHGRCLPAPATDYNYFSAANRLGFALIGLPRRFCVDIKKNPVGGSVLSFFVSVSVCVVSCVSIIDADMRLVGAGGWW